MPLESDSHWYAIRTRSRAEKVVREQLTARGIETLLPLICRVSQWKDRKKRIEWPLFSGYCFGHFPVSERLTVLQAPGVVEIIGSARDRPEAIPDSEMLALQRVLGSGRPYESHPALHTGMIVEISRGPLIGIRGTLVRKGIRCRIVLTINLINQGAAVDLDADDISPVEPFAQPA